MKKIILCIISFLLLVSCATTPLEISENDAKLRMIGGKEALLNAIKYPKDALNKGIEGVVTILAYVDTSGSVRECKIIKGNEFLNEAATCALEKQHFYPYILEGKKRPVRVAIPISFLISKEINVNEFEEERIKAFAEYYLNEPLLTLVDFPSERSSGNKNEFYSEGKTWWPNPDNPDAAYIIREGFTNPDAFRKHAALLERAGEIIPGLTAAYLTTNKNMYAEKAIEHLRAWFIDPLTRMEPHMKYAQAIPNRSTGRGVGIYEALSVVEILQSIPYLEKFLTNEEIKSLRSWFKDYSDFLVDDPSGMSIRMRKDTYGSAYLLQLCSIADYLEDDLLLDNCRDYFSQYSLPHFASYDSPLLNPALNRTFKDNIFLNTDLLIIAAYILTDKDFDAWNFKISSGQRVGDVVNYLYSGILNDKLKTMGNYDGRFLSLLFAGKAYDNPRYLELWRDLQVGRDKIGNFPIRQPILWIK